MIDLSKDFSEGVQRLQVWKNRYTRSEYPHKVVLNVIYRAYAMDIIWKEFQGGKLPKKTNFQEAVPYMASHYADVCLQQVNTNLMKWISANPNQMVGNCNFAWLDEVAKDAEVSASDLQLLEKGYLINLLNDLMVLYFIATKISGDSDEEAIVKLTNYQVQMTGSFTYASAKNAFSELITEHFLESKGIRL